MKQMPRSANPRLPTPPSPDRTTTATSITLADTDPAFGVAPAAVPRAATQLPQNQVLPAQSTQAAVTPAAVHTQEPRAAAANAEKEARCNKLRADAMAKAAVQMAKDSINKPVGATDGMDCTS